MVKVSRTWFSVWRARREPRSFFLHCTWHNAFLQYYNFSEEHALRMWSVSAMSSSICFCADTSPFPRWRGSLLWSGRTADSGCCLFRISRLKWADMPTRYDARLTPHIVLLSVSRLRFIHISVRSLQSIVWGFFGVHIADTFWTKAYVTASACWSSMRLHVEQARIKTAQMIILQRVQSRE